VQAGNVYFLHFFYPDGLNNSFSTAKFYFKPSRNSRITALVFILIHVCVFLYPAVFYTAPEFLFTDIQVFEFMVVLTSDFALWRKN
jgi:hypothetical protein